VTSVLCKLPAKTGKYNQIYDVELVVIMTGSIIRSRSCLDVEAIELVTR